MSREAYVPPTQLPDPQNAFGSASGTVADPNAKAQNVMYTCADCNQKVAIPTNESAVRCHHCGCRILYKMRTTRMVQFEAR